MHPVSSTVRSIGGTLFAAFALALPARAQVIQIKTLPIADGDQFRFIPPSNAGMGSVSIALQDTLFDPFSNPAAASRLAAYRQGAFFGSPTFYSVSHDAGGGRTLPIGGIGGTRRTFGGIVLALQQIDPAQSTNVLTPVSVMLAPGNQTTVAAPPLPSPSRENRYAFGTVGHMFGNTAV